MNFLDQIYLWHDTDDSVIGGDDIDEATNPDEYDWDEEEDDD